MHDKARGAARAGVCAAQQGRFWELHDQMFENQDDLELDEIRDMAESLDLDMEAFNGCLESPYSLGEIQADMTAANNMARSANQSGVGTPLSLVNGMLVRGAQPFEAFRLVIDHELGIDRSGGGSEGSGAASSGQ
ncbi:MAG: thioredoxin domain-containing protein [Myxococcales bacterium]|nr:thioredoxin domain-containing protein [Myxococcales bacterium]